jgi:hypothetical protein
MNGIRNYELSTEWGNKVIHNWCITYCTSNWWGYALCYTGALSARTPRRLVLFNNSCQDTFLALRGLKGVKNQWSCLWLSRPNFVCWIVCPSHSYAPTAPPLRLVLHLLAFTTFCSFVCPYSHGEHGTCQILAKWSECVGIERIARDKHWTSTEYERNKHRTNTD